MSMLGPYTYQFIENPAQGRVLLLLHGTGGDEHDLLPLGRMLDPQASLLSPRGNVLEQGMPRFFRRLAEGVFDLQDVRRRAAELAAFVQVAATAHAFERDSLLAVGYSNGANIAAAVMLLHPGVIRRAILLRGMSSIRSEAHQATAAGSAGAALLLSGERDPIATPQRASELANDLRSARIDLRHTMLPVGHELTRADIDVAQTWLSECAAAPAPAE